MVVLLLLLIAITSLKLIGVTVYVVVNDDMKPTLCVGDVVLLIHSESNIGIGDIIGYISNEEIVISRVVKIVRSSNEIAFITKGDASKDPNPEPIYISKVIGKYLLHVPRIGWFAIIIKELLRMTYVIDVGLVNHRAEVVH
ncbi:MAG: signal peptidase I [Desulfurococcales archaeon ex4484_42]|nr:MAG: signal peptidase I [Desulfurococcales archaeon ex4484_42]